VVYIELVEYFKTASRAANTTMVESLGVAEHKDYPETIGEGKL